MERVRECVRDTWRCELRPHQIQAIEAALAGRDVLVTVATGGGKSLVYQALGFVRSPVLVVSPLIALIQDQVQAARARGMRVTNLCESSLIPDDAHLVYATPERAVRHLTQHAWGAIAIDEAHCVVTWGSGFRPEYGQLRALRESHEARRVPLIALTASATPRMLDEIRKSLGLVRPVHVAGTFARPNLTFRVLPKKHVTRADTKYADVQALVQPPCIVYVTRRDDAEELAEALSMFRAAPYHAHMSPEDRAQVVELFMSDEIRVVCATIAFGMGIDKPDVRSVVHYGPSRSIENYYQEAGRAGRDGQPSTCTLLAAPADWVRMTRLSDVDLPAVRAMEHYASGAECFHQRLLRHFGEASEPCGRCGVCMAPRRVIACATLSEDHAAAAVAMVTAHPFFGITTIAAALRGDTKAHQKLRGMPEYGAWKAKSNKTIHTALKQLIANGAIREQTRRLTSGGSYVSLGPG